MIRPAYARCLACAGYPPAVEGITGWCVLAAITDDRHTASVWIDTRSGWCLCRCGWRKAPAELLAHDAQKIARIFKDSA